MSSGYTTSGTVERVIESNGNAYAELGGNDVITTAAFTIGSAVQQSTLLAIGLTANDDYFDVQALSGANYLSVINLATGIKADDLANRDLQCFVAARGVD
ncbi:MAG: hypothetical protein R2867_01210 [Caldilineaceae bacterium]